VLKQVKIIHYHTNITEILTFKPPV
jgi:hypothetical protein